MENLNEFEKIGLAFVSGLVAGQALKEADEEVEKEEKTEKNVFVGKLEGEKAEEFVKMIDNLGGR